MDFSPSPCHPKRQRVLPGTPATASSSAPSSSTAGFGFNASRAGDAQHIAPASRRNLPQHPDPVARLYVYCVSHQAMVQVLELRGGSNQCRRRSRPDFDGQGWFHYLEARGTVAVTTTAIPSRARPCGAWTLRL